MKKVILTIVAVLTMAITPATAQIFLDDEDWNDGRLRADPQTIGAIIPMQNDSHDQYVPVGGGMALLAGMGVVYLLGRRKKGE